MGKLDNKVAVITGGTRGLGYGIAEAFAREGAAVVVASRSRQNVEDAARQLQSQGMQSGGYACDVSKLSDVQALAAFAVDRFGRFDIWVNNAGISCPTGPTVHVPPQMVSDLVQTNIMGAYHGSITAMRQFLQQGSGKLINMVGKGERAPVPLHNAYASSRAWAHNFSLALAKEYKDTGIGVFVLNPGLVETDMLQNLHFIEGYEHMLSTLRVVTRILAKPPAFAARKAVWLASPATDGRTGLRVSTLGMGAALGGLGRELLRMAQRKAPPPFNPHIDLVKPAVAYRLPEQNGRKPQRNPKKGDWITSLHQKTVSDSIGAKASGLHQLEDKGFRIPQTLVISWEAYLQHRKGEPVWERLREELQSVIQPGKAYAVRSSASVEDSPEHSFAGMFQTALDLHSLDEIIEGIQRVWDSAQSEAVLSYQQQKTGGQADVKMAVILQEMIFPVLSGVAFSRNPITMLDEVLIEAVEGPGTRLVQDGYTPYRWVNKWGNWISQPESSPATQELIDQVASQTRQIAAAAKKDVDLEWVYDGQQLYWLQMRDITTLEKENIYSNKISKEMTPGLIKPLVWSVTLPIPAGVWIDFFSQIKGEVVADPKTLAKAIHYRAYHNIGVFGKIFESLGMPREMLEIMLGVAPKNAGKPPFKPSMKMMRLIPRMLLFGYDKWTFGKRAERQFPGLEAESYSFPVPPDPDRSAEQILAEIDRIAVLNKKTTYNTILSILLMQFYNRMLGSMLQSAGVDFQEFDLTAGMEELKQYDPGQHLGQLNGIFRELDPAAQALIRSGDYGTLRASPAAGAFTGPFETFMQAFGHMSDATGDFGSVPWRETPEIILKLVAEYEKPPDAAGARTAYSDLRRKKMGTGLFYRRARQFRLLREKYSSIYTYTLMLFRAYYLALGERFVEAGWIDSALDIFYLYDEEVRAVIENRSDGSPLRGLISERKMEMELAKDIILPEIVFGEKHPPIVMAIGERLSGTPTSRGYYTGKVKVIQGIADFPKLENGDVLVIPHSDVGWVPLFAKAGAVVAESGGILSHSSIIAREYGIPAVVSVTGALQLCDNTIVSIDGYKGEVMIHADHQDESKVLA